MRGPAALDSVGHPSPGRNALHGWRVAAGLLVAPAAFVAQLISSYAVAAQSCANRGAPSAGLIVINLAALALLMSGLVLSFGNHRALRHAEGGTTRELHDKGDGRTRFLVQFGLWMSLVFATAGIFELSAILFLGRCAGFAATA